jgi:hypothetical protein
MKKILIPAIAIVLLQGSYILKLRHDLNIRKTINEEIIMDVLNKTFDNIENKDKQTVYVELQNDELSEPSNYKDDINIIERIEMLEMHLDYNPSKKWIKDVLSSVKSILYRTESL